MCLQTHAWDRVTPQRSPELAGFMAIGRGVALTVRKRIRCDPTQQGDSKTSGPIALVNEAEALLSGDSGQKNLRTGKKAGSCDGGCCSPGQQGLPVYLPGWQHLGGPSCTLVRRS